MLGQGHVEDRGFKEFCCAVSKGLYFSWIPVVCLWFIDASGIRGPMNNVCDQSEVHE